MIEIQTKGNKIKKGEKGRKRKNSVTQVRFGGEGHIQACFTGVGCAWWGHYNMSIHM